MGSRFIVGLLGLVAGFAIALGLFGVGGPTTEDLDLDIRLLDERIQSIEQENESYETGLLHDFNALTVASLRNTRSMLAQKRASILRAVRLSYTIDGKPAPESADPEELAGILKDITVADADIESALAEAEQYSGGLLESLQLVSVATARSTRSLLQRHYFARKYGFPTVMRMTEGEHAVEPLGTTVSDGEGL